MNWLFFKLFRVYSYSVKMSKEGNFSWCTCKPVVLLNKPTAVLTVSLPSPSSLLKLPSSRATTAEKCAKERDGRAKLLFCLSIACVNPLLFLPFSLPSPSWLRKLPIYLTTTCSRKHCHRCYYWHLVFSWNQEIQNWLRCKIRQCDHQC